MLGKMLVHGLVAAAIVGGTAAVYAQSKDNGTPFPQVAQTEAAGRSDITAALTASNDDVAPAWAEMAGDDRDRQSPVGSNRPRHRHDRERDHDDND